MNDWIRDRLRPEPVTHDAAAAEQPVSFDGGARVSIPAPAPSMSTILRRARNGGWVVGDGGPPPSAA